MGCKIVKALKQDNYKDGKQVNDMNIKNQGQYFFQASQKEVINENKLQIQIQENQKCNINGLIGEGFRQQGIENKDINIADQQQLNNNRIITDSQLQCYLDNLNRVPPQQLQNEQKVENNQILQKYCSQHQDNLIGVLNLNPKSATKLCCIECILQNNLPTQQIIQIKDIFNKTKSQFINNWSYFDSVDSKQILQNIYSSETESSIIQHIKQQFTSFKENINKQIDSYFIKIEKSMNKLGEQKELLIEEFEKNNFQQLMKEVLSQNKYDENQLEKQITSILSDQQQQTKQMETHLQKYLTFQSKQINYLFNQLKIFPQNLQMFIQQKDLFEYHIPQQVQQQIEKLKLKLDQVEELSVDLIKRSNKWQNSGIVKMNELQQIELLSNNNYQKQFYLDMKLLEDQKYEITVQTYKQQPDEYMFIGILPYTKIHTSFVAEYKLYIPIRYNPSDTYNLHLEKGILINQDQSTNKEIKLQISLKDKLFKWKFGANINYLNNWNNFQQQESHYLIFYLEDTSQKFIIKNIKRVHYFDKW